MIRKKISERLGLFVFFFVILPLERRMLSISEKLNVFIEGLKGLISLKRNGMKNMLALSQERFSARKFTSEAVSQEDVDYMMECVRLAPSAVNRQPWHWLIVRSDEAKEKLRECYDREWFKTAPMYIVGMKNVNENWVRRYDEKPHGDIDVAIAAEHLCLAATERGLGTCWVCNYDTDKMQQFFPRESFEAVVIIPLGHIAEDCPHAEKKRKEMNEIVEEI